MKANQRKFDYITEVLVEAGIESDAFIRKGIVGESKEYLSDQQQEEINEGIRGLGTKTRELIEYS